MDLRAERLSETNTLLARCRNLLQERGVEMPPEMKDQISDHLESYKKYLETKIDSEVRKRKDDIESLERSFELIEDQQARRGIQEQINRLEKEIQEIETRDTESLVADPHWI